MSTIELLNEMRNYGGAARTRGLPDDVLLQFAERDKRLPEAVQEANSIFHGLKAEEPELLAMDETHQVEAIQEAYVNFYPDDAINPYVALSASGPWIVSNAM
jgi:hypothetical protein